MSYKIIGMKELQKTLNGLDKVPTKSVTKAAKKGIQIAKWSAKRGGWIDQTGYLRKGIKEKLEKSKIKGKKVYDLMPNASYNDVFVKTSKSGKRSYYPASQEYGFKTKNGGYVPGFHYLKESLTDNKMAIEIVMVDTLSREIDKALNK